jgi:hypothetical protein
MWYMTSEAQGGEGAREPGGARVGADVDTGLAAQNKLELLGPQHGTRP